MVTPRQILGEGGITGFDNPKHKRQSVSSSQKSAVLIKQKWKCWKCHKPLMSLVKYHHVKHVSKGGKSVTGNLVALHTDCHDKIHILEKAKKQDKKRKTRKYGGLWGNLP